MINNNLFMKPKNDYVFKKIFGDERNSDILKSLLESILNKKIQFVEVINGEIPKGNIEDKKSILDIRATIDDNIQVDIEMQVSRTIYMPARSLYYWAKMYSEQLNIGEKYNGLKKTICINFVDFEATKSKTYHSVYKIIEKDQGYILTDVMELHFIEMNKLSDEDDKLSQWVRFIKGDSREEMEKMAIANKDIDRALEVLNTMTMSKKERAAYLSREMALHDEATRIAEATEEGMKIGIEKGIEKGIEQGIEKGERLAQVRTAKNLRSLGVDVEVIAKSTGLSVEEIRKL